MTRDLKLVAIALFTWGMGESAYVFFQPLYLEELGASPLVIGSILGGVGVAMTVTHIPAGYLADRIGKRKMMWAAWFFGIVSGAFMAIARTLPVFTIGVIMYGITIFVVSPLNSYVTAARGKWSVGRAITVTSASFNTGAILGPILGGVIGERYGFSTIYLYATCVFVISTIVILFIKPKPIETQTTRSSRKDLLNPGFIRFLPIFFLAILGMYITQPLAPNYLQNVQRLSLQQIGALGSISSLGTVTLSLIAGSMNTGSGFIFGQIAAGLFPLFLWQGIGFPWFAVGYFMLGGFRAARAMAMAQISKLIPPVIIGTAYGIAESVSGAAIIIAPPLAGFLYEVNPDLIFQSAIVLLVISTLLSFTISKGKTTIQPTSSSVRSSSKKH
jgi:MFS family permease